MQTIEKTLNIWQKFVLFTINASHSRWFRNGVIAVLATLFLLAYGKRVVVQNAVVNPGFEFGTNAWYANTGSGVVEVTRDCPHSGRSALVSTKRSAHWNGPQQNLLQCLQPGVVYVCSGWVRVQNGTDEPVRMTIRQRDEKGNNYHPVTSTCANTNKWRFFSGRFEYKPNGLVQEIVLYFEGPKQGADLLVDDVRIVPDRFLQARWPFGSLGVVMLGGLVFGLATKRSHCAISCGMTALWVSLGLLASWFYDHRGTVVIGAPPDYVKMFRGLGFEKVVEGPLLEIKQNIEEPTLYQGTGVRIYGNCATNLAIIAKNAEIYGRVQGKIYFRGEKLKIQPSADVWGGIDASGQVVRSGTIRTLTPETQSKEPTQKASAKAAVESLLATSKGKLGLEAEAYFGAEIATELAAEHQFGPASNEVGRLRFVECISGNGLRGLAGVVISTNGQNLYAASYGDGTLIAFRRDIESGRLRPIQVLHEGLGGAMNLRISPDQRYAVVIAVHNQALILYKRDLETGLLEPLHAICRKEGVHGLGFVQRVKWSPDMKQVYTLDGLGGGISTFTCNPATGFQWLETLANEATAKGSRGIDVLADGRTIVVANVGSHMLAVFARDPASGRLSLRQTIHDGQDGADQLKGQFGVVGSPDGKFVYVISGVFGGDQAVSVFRVTLEGTLEHVQNFVDGQDELVFQGGRDATISPDGRNLYAVARKSATLACFARDAVTGKLRLIESFVHDPQKTDRERPAALECSPDGRFVYVPLEGRNAIAIFKREFSSGN